MRWLITKLEEEIVRRLLSFSVAHIVVAQMSWISSYTISIKIIVDENTFEHRYFDHPEDLAHSTFQIMLHRQHHQKQQQQSLHVIGTERLGAMSACIGEELSSSILGVRFFGTISGCFPYPAIPPYQFRTLHFVESRLWKRPSFVRCLPERNTNQELRTLISKTSRA